MLCLRLPETARRAWTRPCCPMRTSARLAGLALIATVVGCGSEVEPAGSVTTPDPTSAVDALPVGTRTAAESHPDDPEGWTPISEFEGEAIDVVRDLFPGGELQRIACYLEGRRDAEAQHGPEWTFFPNGVRRAVQTWSHGVLEGPFQAWYVSGVLRFEGTYVDGKRHGVFRQYFKNSDRQLEFEYDHGTAHGVWREWFVGNAPSKEERFVHGRLTGIRRLWGKPETEDDGVVVLGPGTLGLEETYLDDELHGPWRDFWPGLEQVRDAGELEHGLRTGRWTHHDEEGRLIRETMWVAGKREGVRTRWDASGQKVEEVTYADDF